MHAKNVRLWEANTLMQNYFKKIVETPSRNKKLYFKLSCIDHHFKLLKISSVI